MQSGSALTASPTRYRARFRVLPKTYTESLTTRLNIFTKMSAIGAGMLGQNSEKSVLNQRKNNRCGQDPLTPALSRTSSPWRACLPLPVRIRLRMRTGRGSKVCPLQRRALSPWGEGQGEGVLSAAVILAFVLAIDWHPQILGARMGVACEVLAASVIMVPPCPSLAAVKVEER